MYLKNFILFNFYKYLGNECVHMWFCLGPDFCVSCPIIKWIVKCIQRNNDIVIIMIQNIMFEKGRKEISIEMLLWSPGGNILPFIGYCLHPKIKSEVYCSQWGQ